MTRAAGPIRLGSKRWRWDGTALYGQMGRVSAAAYDSGHLVVVWPAGVPNPGLEIRQYSSGEIAEAVGRIVASALEEIAEETGYAGAHVDATHVRAVIAG